MYKFIPTVRCKFCSTLHRFEDIFDFLLKTGLFLHPTFLSSENWGTSLRRKFIGLVVVCRDTRVISSVIFSMRINFNNHTVHDRQTDRQTSRLVFTARLRPQFQMPPVRGSVVRIRGMMRTQYFWIRTSLSSTAAARRHAASTAAARYDRREVAGMANFKMYLRQFCSNRVEFFTIYRRHTQKNDGPEF